MRYVIVGMLVVCSGSMSGWGEEATAAPGKKTAKRKVWIAVPGEATLLQVEDPPEGVIGRDVTPQTAEGLDVVTKSVNRELRDVARALRSLDQSYTLRGFQGCGAATAGSVFIDWRAQGIRKPDHVIVLPPAPIVLGIPKARCCCEHCHRELRSIHDQCDCEIRREPALPFPPAPIPESSLP